MDQDSGQELLDLNVAVQSMVKAFNQLTQNLAAKEQQITQIFQEQRLQDEQALAQMNHRLKVSLEAAAIAHEINQPLSILRLTAQRLQHQLRGRAEADDPAELLESMQILDDQASRIARTTDQMKAIIRNANTSLSRIDLRDVLDSIELYVKSNLIEASSWISTSLPSELKGQKAWVEGDVVQLQIAVINLVKNAVDALSHQPQSTVAPEIVIRLERWEQHWAIVVDDNGPGIPDDLTHTGDMPLYSSKPSGSGLGLFIVRSAMESHNGELTLGISPSGGTRAVLLLPRQG
jgi:C4-dicarboxylate-specific signal transduction histidine kinase